MSTSTFSLWSDESKSRFFLIPEDGALAPGHFRILSLSQELKDVDPASAEPFEVTRAQADGWAKDQLGDVLVELRHGLGEKIAEWRQGLERLKSNPVAPGSPLTPDAGPAVLALLAELPGIIGRGLSGDSGRVTSARTTLQGLHERLKQSGIDVDPRMTTFADRIADLRACTRTADGADGKGNADA